MKRKLIYTIIFISIFLMSSASMIQPVRGYEPPDIPAEAKGMTIDDAEITAYDEDELEERLGKGFDIKDIKNGDPDIIGARSQFKIIDWETDEDLIDYEEDFIYGAVDFKASADVIRGTFWAVSNRTPNPGLPPLGPLLMLASAVNTTLQGIAVTYNTTVDGSILTWPELMAIYSESYDGTILDREVWDYLDPAEEFDPNDPDTDDDEVPYLLDPRDWRTSWDNTKALKDYILGRADTIQAALDNWFLYTTTLSDGEWAVVNVTLAAIPGLNTILLSIVDTNMVLSAYMLGSYIHQNVKLSTEYSVPDKAGYLLTMLEAGQPCCGPNSEDFLAKVLEEFNINEDLLWRIPWVATGEDYLGLMGAPLASSAAADGISAIPVGTNYMALGMIPVPMGGETIYVYAEVKLEYEGGTITYEVEYQDGQIDPRDLVRNQPLYMSLYGTPLEDDPDELKDWEWDIYSVGGAPNTIKDGDDILWQSTGIESAIPGYEVTVILGVSLVSVVGLIYVIMRKRKK